MTRRISFQNVGFASNHQKLFEHFSFTLKEGKDVCLIGQNGVGKSTLLKAIEKKVTFQGAIQMDGKIEVLSEIPQYKNTIEDLLHYEELSKIEQQMVYSFLKYKDYSYPFLRLSKKNQLKILVLEKALARPNFLFIDDIFSCFSKEEKREILKLLHFLSITVFYITSDIEDTLLFPYLVIMGKKGILMEGVTTSVLKEEKIMKRLGYTLPFYIDLSLQLKSYELIHQIYTNEKELTDNLWK